MHESEVLEIHFHLQLLIAQSPAVAKQFEHPSES